MGVVVKFNLATAQSPNDAPTVAPRELAQLVLAQPVEESHLAWVGNEMLRLLRKLLRDHSRHRLESLEQLFVHLRTSGSPSTRRLGGVLRSAGKSLGVGGGLSGRFSFGPSAFLAFSAGVGPRADGFFIAN